MNLFLKKMIDGYLGKCDEQICNKLIKFYQTEWEHFFDLILSKMAKEHSNWIFYSVGDEFCPTWKVGWINNLFIQLFDF